MSIFSKIFRQGRSPESRAVSRPEVIDVPVGFKLEGRDAEGWGDKNTLIANAVIPPEVTRLTIGEHQLSLIARIDRNSSIEGVEIVSAQDLKRGSIVTLSENLLLAVPYPS